MVTSLDEALFGMRGAAADSAEVQDFTEWLLAERKWRPIVVIALRDSRGRFIVGEQNNPERNWSLVQGGIEAGETLREALLREINEEISLSPESIEYTTSVLHTGTIPYPSNRASKRGFTKGKAYLCVGAQLKPNVRTSVIPKSDEAPEVLALRRVSSGTACRLCTVQPGVVRATESTREKGRRILKPLVRAMEDEVHEREIGAILARS